MQQPILPAGVERIRADCFEEPLDACWSANGEHVAWSGDPQRVRHVARQQRHPAWRELVLVLARPENAAAFQEHVHLVVPGVDVNRRRESRGRITETCPAVASPPRRTLRRLPSTSIWRCPAAWAAQGMFTVPPLSGQRLGCSICRSWALRPSVSNRLMGVGRPAARTAQPVRAATCDDEDRHSGRSRAPGTDL